MDLVNPETAAGEKLPAPSCKGSEHVQSDSGVKGCAISEHTVMLEHL